jgi:DNA polymerase-3 subunit alpha
VDLRVVNRGVIEALIFCGALDDLFPSRKWMIEHLEELLHDASVYQNDKRNGQSLLFDSYEEEKEEMAKPSSEDLEDFDYNEKLEFEKERVGFYISGHPLDPYKSVIRDNATYNSKSLHSLDAENTGDDQQKFRYGSKVKVAGIVRSRQMMVDKSGKSWCKMSLEDNYGSVDALVFAKNYEMLLNEGKIPETGEIVLVTGTYRNNGGPAITVSDIDALTPMLKNSKSEFHIYLRDTGMEPEQLQRMKSRLAEIQGDLTIYFHIHDEHSPKGWRVFYVSEFRMTRDKAIYTAFEREFDIIEKISVV